MSFQLYVPKVRSCLIENKRDMATLKMPYHEADFSLNNKLSQTRISFELRRFIGSTLTNKIVSSTKFSFQIHRLLSSHLTPLLSPESNGGVGQMPIWRMDLAECRARRQVHDATSRQGGCISG